jgi:pimeloyl-ACP methyl ester carboxylesterase
MSLPIGGAHSFRGSEIRYGIMGPEGAPALVLLHGTPFSAHEWRRIAPWLARHFRVYFYDMLGYGASAKGDLPDVSLGIQNEVFAALLDHWALERPHVVAHDFGGATALRA